MFEFHPFIYSGVWTVICYLLRNMLTIKMIAPHKGRVLIGLLTVVHQSSCLQNLYTVEFELLPYGHISPCK